MVYIRTDANSILATGHMMRCMTIAKELIKAGEQVIFLVSDINSTLLLEENGYKYINLESDWKNPNNENELIKLREIFSGYKDKYRIKPMLLMDSYSISEEYTGKIKAYAVTAIIDDLFEEKYYVDMIINYTLYSVKFDYENRYSDMNTILRLGTEYVPLRDEFKQNIQSEGISSNIANKENKNKKVLIMCGGGDIYDAIGGILHAVSLSTVSQIKKSEYYAVAGAYNPNRKKLLQYSEQNPNIHIYENVNNMAELMRECDIAISAASTVLYECCAMALPTIFFCVADNQIHDIDCFSQDDVMLYAGDMKNNRAAAVSSIIKQLEEILNEEEKLLKMKEKMRDIIDGNGAKRIAEEIINIHKERCDNV